MIFLRNCIKKPFIARRLVVLLENIIQIFLHKANKNLIIFLVWVLICTHWSVHYPLSEMGKLN